MDETTRTWHYGLVARYWAEHNTTGPEIAYYQKKYENLYFYNELLMMIEQAGFKIEAVEGDYKETEVSADNNFMIFIARK